MDAPALSMWEFYREGLALLPAPWFGVLAFFVAGMVGSFLNVCIWRIPRGQSVVTPRSRCPACAHVLGVADLIPILSWAAAGGKCRYCATPIALRYQWVELTNISLWFGAWAVFGRTLFALAVAAALSAALGVVGVAWMRARMAAAGAGDPEPAGGADAPGAAAAEPDPAAGPGPAAEPGRAAEPDPAAPADPAPASDPRPARAGFSFIELVVSVAILGSIVTPFMLAIQASYRGSGRNRQFLQAYNLAREKIEELRAVPVTQLKSDWDVYVQGPTPEYDIFHEQFFGPYAKMRANPENFYAKFSDVMSDEGAFVPTVMSRFRRNFKNYYGFDYETYPPSYRTFRRSTQVEDITDPRHPSNVLKKVTVTVVITPPKSQKGAADLPISMVAYMTNR